VIEILSPSTAHRDRGIELERYRHFGVPDYWIVDIDQRTSCRRGVGSDREAMGCDSDAPLCLSEQDEERPTDGSSGSGGRARRHNH